MRNGKISLFLTTSLFAAFPALAQAPAGQPTPPPALSAENSVINPPYADAPEYTVNPATPQGESVNSMRPKRRFIPVSCKPAAQSK